MIRLKSLCRHPVLAEVLSRSPFPPSRCWPCSVSRCVSDDLAAPVCLWAIVKTTTKGIIQGVERISIMGLLGCIQGVWTMAHLHRGSAPLPVRVTFAVMRAPFRGDEAVYATTHLWWRAWRALDSAEDAKSAKRLHASIVGHESSAGEIACFASLCGSCDLAAPSSWLSLFLILHPEVHRSKYCVTGSGSFRSELNEQLMHAEVWHNLVRGTVLPLLGPGFEAAAPAAADCS